jgi:hypothetical protein
MHTPVYDKIIVVSYIIPIDNMLKIGFLTPFSSFLFPYPKNYLKNIYFFNNGLDKAVSFVYISH